MTIFEKRTLSCRHWWCCVVFLGCRGRKLQERALPASLWMQFAGRSLETCWHLGTYHHHSHHGNHYHHYHRWHHHHYHYQPRNAIWWKAAWAPSCGSLIPKAYRPSPPLDHFCWKIRNAVEKNTTTVVDVRHRLEKTLGSWCFDIFIGPESDHWLCLSLTDWLTNWLTAV